MTSPPPPADEPADTPVGPVEDAASATPAPVDEAPAAADKVAEQDDDTPTALASTPGKADEYRTAKDEAHAAKELKSADSPAADTPPATDAIGKPLLKTKDGKKKHKEPKGPKETLPASSTLVEQAGAYIEELFAAKLSSKLVFHDLNHTKQVVKAARRLAADQHFSEADTEALLVAAWFHDAGYVERYVGHEEASAELAARFLRERRYPQERIELVRQLIAATAVGAPANGLLADTLVDADRSGMAREEFASHGELLRLEWEMFLPDRAFTNPEWVQYQLEYLTDTDFRTTAARTRYGPGRAANLAAQEKTIGKQRKKEKKKEKEGRETLAQPKRGIETMFHNIYATHMGLSQMADQKANMMIQLNTLLLSALITYLAARTTTNGIAMLQNPIVVIPGVLLLTTALGSVVTAILSAQPEITSFRLNNKVKPTANRRINLLFFGNFVKLPLEEFQEGMRDLMRQKDALYINMITDVYYLGDVLSKKYRLLKVSYTIFMVGIIMTVFSFVISILYKGHL